MFIKGIVKVCINTNEYLIRACQVLNHFHFLKAAATDKNQSYEVLSRLYRRPRTEKMYMVTFSNIDGPDQPPHPHSLIRAFNVHLPNIWAF